MIELTAPTLNAPDMSSLLSSLLPALGAPAASTTESAPIALDFSAMLTEMIGPAIETTPGIPPAEATIPGLPAVAVVVAAPQIAEVKIPGLQIPELKTSELEKPEAKTPELKTTELKTTELQIPALKTSELNKPEAQSLEVKTPEVKISELKTPELEAKPLGLKPLELKPLELKSLEPKTATPEVCAEVKTPQLKVAQPITPEVTVPVVQATETLTVAETPEALKLEVLPELTTERPATSRPKEAKAQESLESSTLQTAIVVAPFVPLTPVSISGPAVVEEKPVLKVAQAVEIQPLPATSKPELEKAWGEVKKFEFTVEREVPRYGNSQPRQPLVIDDAQAMVTSDPIANLQQQQLPPRMLAVQRMVLEAGQPDRGKQGFSEGKSETITTPIVSSGDTFKSLVQVEQVRPAHYVEIPIVPQPQVVRTVAMEVGEAGSNVTIRIQERGGDVSLQLDPAGNEPLRRNLQSSLGSLVHTLRQEDIKIAVAEVTKRSPIAKVTRMKEAH